MAQRHIFHLFTKLARVVPVLQCLPSSDPHCRTNLIMTQAKPLIKVEDGDELATKLLQLGNELKPIDDENFFFFEIVRELVDAALTNLRSKRAH
jgi:hypothetical protein